MSARLNRRGAILPLTILMLAVMGVAVAITYARLSSERRTTSDAQAQMNAFAVAQSGLSRFFSNLPVNVKPGWLDPMDVTYNDLPGGTAQVSLRMIRDTTMAVNQLPAVYAIVSRGTNTSARRFGSSTPPAERTVATYGLWTPTPFEVNGAITSLNGLNKNGNSGTLSGFDRCASAPTVAGVAVPDVPGAGYPGDPTPIQGNPMGAPVSLGTGGTAGTAKDEVDIDWAGIIAGTYLPPDYVSPSWPASFTDWPVVRVNNTAGPTFTLPGTGKGILIVTGDLHVNGAVGWEGLILVGGKLTSNGNNQVFGAVVAGLNIKLGIDPGISDIANGVKNYQYDSCALKRALSQVGSIQPVRNGWVDTWPSYQ